MTDAFTYAELDEILRGSGHSGAIGMSAIDGLIAALVAAPSFVQPDEWVPLVFGGHQPPLDENSPELRVVKTIFNRCRVGRGGAIALPPPARSNGSCSFPASRFPMWVALIGEG
jgi:hypothetical protein